MLCAGTTYSGYAYSFTVDHEDIHIMRKWEGDDPGNWRLVLQKVPSEANPKVCNHGEGPY